MSDLSSVDECLHDYLDGKPAGKHSKRDRAAGLLSTSFWWQPAVLDQARLASLALAQVLWVLDEIDHALLDQLAQHNPDLLRQAIRYSKLFATAHSKVYEYLRQSLTEQTWTDFFNVCDRLLAQLKPFEMHIEQAEHQLKPLKLVELLSYLSVLAYPDLDQDDATTQRSWAIYERIIQRKLQRCTDRDFDLTEQILGKSLKQHLSPLLFQEEGAWERASARLESVAFLTVAVGELIDYQASIDAFCFDSDMHYQWKDGQPVTFKISEDGSRQWQQTEQKAELLWSYWMRRAIDAYARSEIAGLNIGQAENHEANQLALIKAVRSQLVMQRIFGFGDKISLAEDSEVDLHQAMLASELSTVFFAKAFIEPYKRLAKQTGSPVKALGMMAFEGALKGENRFPMTWSTLPEKVKRVRTWTVSNEYPQGDATAAKAILQFWTVDLRQLSAQIKQSPRVPVPKLTEQPFCKIGRYSFQFPWIAGRQSNLVAAVNTLRRLEARRPALRSETERVESCLADALRSKGFSVVLSYMPPDADGKNVGEMDLVCHLNGVVLLLEVKSGFIRSTQHEVWLHRTNTLRKAARQLRRKQQALRGLLESDESLRLELGLSGCADVLTIRSWVVDTSIECDGEMINGFRVVSREVIEVALFDQKHYLVRFDDACEEPQPQTLYPHGFSAHGFVSAIEAQAVWEGVLANQASNAY